MSFPHDNTDDWLDLQLRAVPVPTGLHERLAQIADAPLAAAPKVAAPIELSAGVDAARVLRSKLTNAQLDARLRDVPVPAELLDRLRAIAAPPRIRWQRLAVAAGLFLALSAAYFGSVGLLTWSIYEPEVATAEREMLLSMIEGYPGEEASDGLVVTWNREHELSPEAVAAPANRSEGLMPRLDLVEQASAAASAEQRGTDIELRHRRPALREEFAMADARLSPDFALARIDGLASPIVAPDAVVHGPPDPRVSVGPRARGVDLPLNQATQKLFMLQYGLHPPLSVKEQPKSPVPLVRSTASYELWREYVERGVWPPVDSIRTEDFLAAADLGGERSPGRPITVTMLGGPSPLGDGQNRLVQIGVRVRDLPEATHRPVHLTLAVDVSPNMQFGNRLAMVKRAISGLAKELGPGDCLDLVRLHGDATPLVEDLRRADEASWQRAVAALEVEPTATNLAAGLMSAFGTVQNGPTAKSMLRRLVIVGDGAAEWDTASRGVIEREAARAAAAGVALSLIHLSPLGAPDPRLVELALASKGRVLHAGSEDPIRWALRETLTGRSQLVARDAKLTISFNPKVVASYRLLGHEPVAVAGLMPARMEADLYAGQSVVAVYEVSLVPPPTTAVATPMPPAPAVNGQPPVSDAPPDVELASVVLQWRDPRGDASVKTAVGNTAAGQPTVRQVGQKLMRSQIRESLDQSPPALQLATLAAVTAEVLRNSPFASSLTLSDVLAWSRELRGPVTLRPAYRDLLTLVEEADRIDAKRGVDIKRRGREGRKP